MIYKNLPSPLFSKEGDNSKINPLDYAKTLILITILSLIVLSSCIYNINLIPTIEPLKEKYLSGSGKDKIVLMGLSGIITDKERSGVLITKPSLVAEIKEELDKASEDPDVKAVVLRINSPGGTVTASDVLYHELTDFKKRTSKKIIASIMDLGTSGGYYAAVSADKIVAHPTTVTGSIGVIMLTMNVEGLLEKIGVSGMAIKSGDKKDMGSPFRPMTDEELAIFQGVIDHLYERFVSVVAAGRGGLTEEDVRRIADGRIYTAQQALELGLVDKIGYLDDAIALAREEAGLEEARVVTYYRTGSYRANIYSGLPNGNASTLNIINLDLRSFLPVNTPQFMYLWMP